MTPSKVYFRFGATRTQGRRQPRRCVTGSTLATPSKVLPTCHRRAARALDHRLCLSATGCSSIETLRVLQASRCTRKAWVRYMWTPPTHTSGVCSTVVPSPPFLFHSFTSPFFFSSLALRFLVSFIRLCLLASRPPSFSLYLSHTHTLTHTYTHILSSLSLSLSLSLARSLTQIRDSNNIVIFIFCKYRISWQTND
jgi:hypothetical protein